MIFLFMNLRGGYGKGLLLTWGVAFVLVEVLGLILVYLTYSSGLPMIYSIFFRDVLVTSLRFPILEFIIYHISGLSLRNTLAKPLPGVREIKMIFIGVIFIAIIDYLIAIVVNGTYSPQLADYQYYMINNAMWFYPFRIAYYLSEITVMNYMYILSKNVWRILEPPITSGTIFLIIVWALPHLITKNMAVALYATILTVILYAEYEYTGSPLTPVILWFASLII